VDRCADATVAFDFFGGEVECAAVSSRNDGAAQTYRLVNDNLDNADAFFDYTIELLVHPN